MVELQALKGDLMPENEDITFLKTVGIIPTTTSSTTTSPYTSGGDSQTDTVHTGILQKLADLDTKITNGFAQIMAKLSNKPIAGGGRRRKTRRTKKRR